MTVGTRVRLAGDVRIRPEHVRGGVKVHLGAAAAAFDPRAIDGLQLWLDAGQLALNHNDPVATWPDASGHAFDMSQATAAKRPVYRINRVNGLPAVRFDGVDDLLEHAGLVSVALSGSVFAVVRGAAPSIWRQVFGCADLAVDDQKVHLFTRSVPNGDTDAFLNVYGLDAEAGQVGSGEVRGDVPIDSRFHHVSWHSDGAAWSLYVDGVAQAITVVQVGNSGAWWGDVAGADVFNVGGAHYNEGGIESEDFFWSGDIAELLVYDGELGDAERQLVEAYLEAKYALPSPAPALPLAIADCVCWLDASSIAGLTDSEPIAQWDDLSAARNHAIQPVVVRRPSIEFGELNGRPVVHFDGLAHALRIPSIAYGPFTIFCVFRSDLAAVRVPFEHSGNANNAPGNHWLSTTGFTSRVRRNPAVAEYSSYDHVVNWGNDNAWRVAAVRFDGTHAGHALWIDGVLAAPWTSPGGVNGVDPGVGVVTEELNLGARNEASLFWRGDMAAVVIYSRALSDVERETVEAHLAARYGL